MDDVSNNHEPLIITHEHHKAVVLMSLDDFNAWQETDYLMRSTANANDLLQAVFSFPSSAWECLPSSSA